MFPDPTIVAENLFRNRFVLKCSITEDRRYTNFLGQYALGQEVLSFNQTLHTFLFPKHGTFYFSRRVVDALTELCDNDSRKIIALFQEPHGLNLCYFLDSQMGLLNTINDDFLSYLKELNKPKPVVIAHYFNYKTNSPLRENIARNNNFPKQHTYTLE